MRRVVLLITLVFACCTAPQALAAPPVLLSAGTTPDLQTTASWALPPGVRAEFIEVATSPAVDADGYFPYSSLAAGDVLAPSQTSWTDVFSLDAGRTYYVHVGGEDTTCGSCPSVEFSNVLSFTLGGTPGVPARVPLTVLKAGLGSGTVTSSPAGIDCGGSCTQLYSHDGHVTLAPAPAPGSVFSGWDGGGCFGIAPTCEVTMGAAQTVVATFDPVPPPSLPALVVARSGATATATFSVCDDSPGPLTIALIQIWRDHGQWKSATTTTTQNHAAGCDTQTVSGPSAVRSPARLWIAVQVTEVDGRQSSLRTAAAP